MTLHVSIIILVNKYKYDICMIFIAARSFRTSSHFAHHLIYDSTHNYVEQPTYNPTTALFPPPALHKISPSADTRPSSSHQLGLGWGLERCGWVCVRRD